VTWARRTFRVGGFGLLLGACGASVAPATSAVVIGNVAPAAAASDDEVDEPAERFDGKTLPAGTRVRIERIDKADAYFSSRLGIEGQHCVVEESADRTFDNCFGGQFHCDNGTGYYFYAACVVLL